MSISVPTNCANPECREQTIRPIHRSSRAIAIDAVDGPPVFAHHTTYRCSQCGHTWAIQGYASTANDWPAKPADSQALSPQTASRGA